MDGITRKLDAAVAPRQVGVQKRLIFEIWFLIPPAFICQFPALTNAPDAGQ
ncbi:hypothetical protein NKH36_15230 [Mesorhizobium sp. M1312]|uniref:hypothetical protein n=1 Tax=unclassified Mesorhizobium TaxID=325217 RepID=UPI00333A48BC